MEDCIFCSIASGRIPAPLLWENDRIAAFPDLHPQAPVHVLIVPKEHFVGLNDAVPAEVLAALLAAVPHIAAAAGIAESGYRLIVNTGADAGQTVPHLHMHLIGGAPLSEGMVKLA